MPGFDQTTPINAGRVLGGRYRLVAPVAKGGMAEVWEGHDEVLSRPVAVKVLQPHLATDNVFLERFRREAVTAARLAHPGIVATFDTGIDSGTAYIVMELVKGRNLRQLLSDNGRLEPWQAVAIARQIADALSYAHQAGLVHRDVKPANVLLVEDEWGAVRVKVTDFGIAKAGAGGSDLTRTGIVLGTPKYLSPEQIKGRDPDPRADLYALGVVLYEMLTGEAPFTGHNDMATAMAHLNERIPRAGAQVKGVPSALDKLVADLLAKNPDRRVPSATVLRQRFDALGPLSAPAGAPSLLANGRRHQKWREQNPQRTSTAVGGAGSTSAMPPPPPTSVMNGANGNGATTRVQPGPPRPPFPPFGTNGSAPPPRGRSGPSTDEMGGPPHPARRFRRSERTAGIVVLVLVVVGAVVAAGLLLSSHNGGKGAGNNTTGGGGGTASTSIASVNVYMVAHVNSPDNPSQTPLTFDGNSSTYWETDQYANATFGNLYPGIGLEIDLSAASTVHKLTVTSPTTGWSAQTYVSTTDIASGQPVATWGQATVTQSSIQGDTTFTLHGRNVRYVLLWITNLGPSPHQVKIAELKVS